MYLLLKQRKNIYIFILSLCHSILIVNASLLVSVYIDHIIAKNIVQFLLYTFLTIILWLLATLISMFRNYLQTLVIQDFICQLRTQETVRLTNQLICSKNVAVANYLNMTLYDAEEISKHAKNLYAILYHSLMVLVTGVTLFNIHYSLLIYVIAAILVMSFVPKFFQKAIKQTTSELSAKMEDFKQDLDHLVNNRETLVNFNVLNWLLSAITTHSFALKQGQVKNTWAILKLQSIVVMLNIMSQIGIVALAGYLSYVNILSFSLIFSISNISGEMLGGMTQMINGAPIYYAMKSLLEKFDFTPQEMICLEQVERLTLHDALRLHQVSVTFGHKTINFPDITFKMGKKYLLSGLSGCGKSTLLKILNGDIRDYQGEICWDNQQYKELTVHQLKHSIVTMSQKAQLFHMSIKQNIILNQDYDEHLLHKVIQQSHLEELIKQLPEGLDTIIDIHHLTLSGGQIQRLSLARCLYHQAHLLLIDEGTANLDVETALAIEQIILSQPHLTVVMVSHHIFDESRQLVDEIIEI